MNERQQILSNYLENHRPLQDRIKMRNPGFIVFAGLTGSGKSTAVGQALQKYLSHFPDGRVFRLVDGNEDENITVRGEVKVEKAEGVMPLGIGRLGADVVAVGEIRAGDSSRVVLELLEAGHNVIASVHASSAEQSMQRIGSMVAMDPPDYLADVDFEDWREAHVKRWENLKRHCLAVPMPDLATL